MTRNFSQYRQPTVFRRSASRAATTSATNCSRSSRFNATVSTLPPTGFVLMRVIAAIVLHYCNIILAGNGGIIVPNGGERMYRIAVNLPDDYKKLVKARIAKLRRKSVSDYAATLIEEDLRQQGMLEEMERKPVRKGPH